MKPDNSAGYGHPDNYAAVTCVIFSGKHEAWLLRAPNGKPCGYARNMTDAGVWPLQEAVAIARGADAEHCLSLESTEPIPAQTNLSRLRPSDIEAIRVRAAAATPGPWLTPEQNEGSDSRAPVNHSECLFSPWLHERDMVFAYAARMDVPRLLAEIAWLQERVALLTQEAAGPAPDPEAGA